MHHFRSDEAAFKIRVDDARRLGGLGPGRDGPGPRFLDSCGEVGAQAQKVVHGADEVGNAGILHAQGFQEFAGFFIRNVDEFFFNPGGDDNGLRVVVFRHVFFHLGDVGVRVRIVDGVRQFVFIDVAGKDAFFVRKELEGMEQLAFVVIQLRFKGEGRIALIQVGQQLGDEGHLRLGFLVSAAGLALPGGKPFVHGGDVRQNELRIDDFNVAQGVHGTKLVDDVVIVKAAHHLHDGVHFTDIRQELVAQSGSFRGALDQAGNVHEFNERGDDFFRAGHVGKHLQAGVRHRDHAHVRINGAEGIIGRLGLAGSGDRVEEGGLADVGETYNTCL